MSKLSLMYACLPFLLDPPCSSDWLWLVNGNGNHHRPTLLIWSYVTCMKGFKCPGDALNRGQKVCVPRIFAQSEHHTFFISAFSVSTIPLRWYLPVSALFVHRRALAVLWWNPPLLNIVITQSNSGLPWVIFHVESHHWLFCLLFTDYLRVQNLGYFSCIICQHWNVNIAVYSQFMLVYVNT